MGNIKGLFHLKRFCSALAFAVCVTSQLHYKLIPVNKTKFTIEHLHNCRRVINSPSYSSLYLFAKPQLNEIVKSVLLTLKKLI